MDMISLTYCVSENIHLHIHVSTPHNFYLVGTLDKYVSAFIDSKECFFCNIKAWL